MNPRSVVRPTPFFTNTFLRRGDGGGSGSYVNKQINDAEIKVVHEPVRTSPFYCTVLLAFQFFQSNTGKESLQNIQ